jgi:hypothetical protein
MKKYKTFIQQEVTELVCDGCGLEAYAHEGYEFSEFISIEHKCGYGAIHGDGNKLLIDLCQHCFAEMCGDTLTTIDPIDNQASDSCKNTLEYQNIFQALTKSKHEAHELKQESDIRIIAREVLSSEKISNQEELQAALKRLEQLWDAQYHSSEGNELHKLADLICAYEANDWDSFFEEIPLADDDFMPDRLNFKSKFTSDEDKTARGMLSSIPVNKSIDDDSSRDSALSDSNLDDAKQHLIESIVNVMAKHPELRLGQLLVNVITPQEPCLELFHIQDDVLAEKINQFSER